MPSARHEQRHSWHTEIWQTDFFIDWQTVSVCWASFFNLAVASLIYMYWATTTRTIPLYTLSLNNVGGKNRKWQPGEGVRFLFSLQTHSSSWENGLKKRKYVSIILFAHCFQGIIQKILDIHKVRWTSCFGLRLSNSQFRDQVHWLHPDMGVSHVREKYEQARPNEEWRWGKRSRCATSGWQVVFVLMWKYRWICQMQYAEVCSVSLRHSPNQARVWPSCWFSGTSLAKADSRQCVLWA